MTKLDRQRENNAVRRLAEKCGLMASFNNDRGRLLKPVAGYGVEPILAGKVSELRRYLQAVAQDGGARS
jgi:hypothetical protein